MVTAVWFASGRGFYRGGGGVVDWLGLVGDRLSRHTSFLKKNDVRTSLRIDLFECLVFFLANVGFLSYLISSCLISIRHFTRSRSGHAISWFGKSNG